MFGKLKEKLGLGGSAALIEIPAPMAGEAVSIKEVSDPTFSEEILGRGVAIRPTGGRVVSPVSGVVETIFDTGHAVSLHADSGVDLLIHVGLDTVSLKGKGYTKHVENGQRVEPGDLLISFDSELILAEGYDTITPVIICNSDSYTDFTFVTEKSVAELAPLVTLK